MITPKNVVKHELIGLKAIVEKTSGTITDETKSTITLTKQNKTKKKIIKKGNTFRITLPDGSIVEIKGELLQGKPQERIKKKIKVKNRWLEI